MIFDDKALVLGTMATDAFTTVNKRVLRALEGDGTAAVVLCELLSVYNYMAATQQIDEVGSFALPTSFLKKTMNLSEFKQRRVLSMLEGGGFVSLSRGGVPAVRRVVLHFSKIATILREDKEAPVPFYATLSSAASSSLQEFDKAMDNIAEPLRGSMLLLVDALRKEGVTYFQWEPMHIGQMKTIMRAYTKPYSKFDYAQVIDLIESTSGASVAERLQNMLYQHKRIMQRAPHERVYNYKEIVYGREENRGISAS